MAGGGERAEAAYSEDLTRIPLDPRAEWGVRIRKSSLALQYRIIGGAIGEAVSTLCCPSQLVPGTEGMRI